MSSYSLGAAYDNWKTSDPRDDEPEATCPVCGSDNGNLVNHGCDEDCRRGCRGMVPAPCNTCAEPCENCGEDGPKDETRERYCTACGPLARLCECGKALGEHDEDFEFCGGCR